MSEGLSFSRPETTGSTDPYAGLFPEGTLVPFKPKTDSVTIFRPIPEIGADGQPKPMVTSFDQFGPLFSNMRMEGIITLAGQQTKWSGFSRCSDYPDLNDFDNPWSGTYIRLKSKVKKNELPDMVKTKVDQLTARGEKHGAQMPKPSECMLIQGFCIQFNGKPCTPPKPGGCLILTPSAVEAFKKVLLDAASKKIDLFDYNSGYALVISGEQKPNGRPPEFKVELTATAMPIPATFQNTWVAWDRVLKFRTYDDHIRQMALCYPRDVIAYNAPVGEAMARLGITVPVQAPVIDRPAASLPPAAPVQAPTAPAAGNPFGAAPAAANPFAAAPAAITAPAAANPFAAAASASANPFAGHPTAAATPVAFPTAAPAPTQAPVVPTTATPDDLAAEYARLMAQNPPKA